MDENTNLDKKIKNLSLKHEIYYRLQKKLSEAQRLACDLKLPTYRENFPDFNTYEEFRKSNGQARSLGVKKGTGHGDAIIQALKACETLDQEILDIQGMLVNLRSDVEDTALSYRNSLQLPYSSEAFLHAWAWQARIRDVKGWDIPEAPDVWEQDYNDCLALVHRLTDGLEIHNVSFSFHMDGSRCNPCFTVAGTPGNFEINFPLVGVAELHEPGYGSSKGIRLTWRREWCIPRYDYFFDHFGSLDFDTVHERLLQFVRNEEWREFYSMEGGEGRDGEWIHYSDDQKKGLQEMLDAEIARCSRENEDWKKYKK